MTIKTWEQRRKENTENGYYPGCIGPMSAEIDELRAELAKHEPTPPSTREPVAWRWSEVNSRTGEVHWFDWTAEWDHHQKAIALGRCIEYAYPSP